MGTLSGREVLATCKALGFTAAGVQNGYARSLSASGFYDGIGVDGLEAYGGSAKLRIPLQR